MAAIAVLGMGAMGSRMAGNLLKAGHDVCVWNRDASRCASVVSQGATQAESPAAATQGREFVISCVRDDAASRWVWLDQAAGALAGMANARGTAEPPAVAIESSTLTVDWVRELARFAADREVPFVDAPVSGSRPQAEAAQLVYLVGGDPAVVDRAKPILMAMGSAVHHVGPAGLGAAVKLAVNALMAIQVTGLAELLNFLTKCGLDETRAADVIGQTLWCSTAAKAAMGLMVARKFEPLFPVELISKDLDYLQQVAQGLSAEVPVAGAAFSVFGQALEAGLNAQNMTAVRRLYS